MGAIERRRHAEMASKAAVAAGNQEMWFVKVPRSREGNWPRAASGRDGESMLQTAIVMDEAQGRSRFRSITVGEAAMGLGGALLLLLAAWSPPAEPADQADD